MGYPSPTIEPMFDERMYPEHLYVVHLYPRTYVRRDWACAEATVRLYIYYLCGRCVVFLVSLFVMAVDVVVDVPHQGAAVPDSRSLSWSFTLFVCFSPSPVRASLVFLP